MEDKNWFLYVVDHHEGPFTENEIKQLIKSGEAKKTSFIWRQGLEDWVMMSNVAEFGGSGPKSDGHGSPSFVVEQKSQLLSGASTAKQSSSAGALGFAGHPGVPRRHRSIRSWFLLLLLIGIGVGGYQGIATKKLDSVFKAAKIEAPTLPPITKEKLIEFVALAKGSIQPLLEKVIPYLPKAAQKYVSFSTMPNGLSAQDSEFFRQIIQSDPKQGLKLGSALAQGTELNPVFHIAVNSSSPLRLSGILRGREGTLLNAVTFEKTLDFETFQHFAVTSPFTTDDNKPLPRGEYLFYLAGPDKKSYDARPYFLGGKRDATYEERLKQFNAQVKSKLSFELTELKQLQSTIESIANESAIRFFKLASGNMDAKKSDWNKYHVQYLKLSNQIRTSLIKAIGNSADHVLPNVYQKLGQTFGLSERLHQSQNEFLLSGGKQTSMDAIREIAKQTVQGLTETRVTLSKLSVK